MKGGLFGMKKPSFSGFAAAAKKKMAAAQSSLSKMQAKAAKSAKNSVIGRHVNTALGHAGNLYKANKQLGKMSHEDLQTHIQTSQQAFNNIVALIQKDMKSGSVSQAEGKTLISSITTIHDSHMKLANRQLGKRKKSMAARGQIAADKATVSAYNRTAVGDVTSQQKSAVRKAKLRQTMRNAKASAVSAANKTRKAASSAFSSMKARFGTKSASSGGRKTRRHNKRKRKHTKKHHKKHNRRHKSRHNRRRYRRGGGRSTGLMPQSLVNFGRAATGSFAGVIDTWNGSSVDVSTMPYPTEGQFSGTVNKTVIPQKTVNVPAIYKAAGQTASKI